MRVDISKEVQRSSGWRDIEMETETEIQIQIQTQIDRWMNSFK